MDRNYTDLAFMTYFVKVCVQMVNPAVPDDYHPVALRLGVHAFLDRTSGRADDILGGVADEVRYFDRATLVIDDMLVQSPLKAFGCHGTAASTGIQ